MSKTLNEYIHLLKPVQQDFIVFCVKAHNPNRKGFHRGLLPFLPADEAARCLKLHLELIKGMDELPAKPIGEKFIHSLISKFADALDDNLYADGTSIDMYLNTGLLAAEFGRRFGPKFCVTLGPGADANTLVELKMIGKNKWRVTCRPQDMDRATTWLADKFR